MGLGVHDQPVRSTVKWKYQMENNVTGHAEQSIASAHHTSETHTTVTLVDRPFMQTAAVPSPARRCALNPHVHPTQ